MTNNSKILDIAKETIRAEASSILALIDFIDEDFEKAIQFIFNSKARLIFSGIGKSAIVAQKIVATLNSTGTSAVFMHTTDAIHGDLGIVQKNDIVVFVSKSGNSPEMKLLIPLIKNNGNKICAIVSKLDSYLAKNADFVFNAFVENEICLNNIVPTSSTTAQMVIGDAIASCLLHLKGFSINDFAQFHPGGTIGKKLYLTVGDLYLKNQTPKVKLNESLKNVIFEISSKRLGATAVVDENNKLLGIITDGDLRRMLQNNQNIDLICAKDILSANPKTISKDALAVDAFHLMEKNNITQLVVTENEIYLGMVHIHDILKEGII